MLPYLCSVKYQYFMSSLKLILIHLQIFVNIRIVYFLTIIRKNSLFLGYFTKSSILPPVIFIKSSGFNSICTPIFPPLTIRLSNIKAISSINVA